MKKQLPQTKEELHKHLDNLIAFKLHQNHNMSAPTGPVYHTILEVFADTLMAYHGKSKGDLIDAMRGLDER